MQTQRLEDYPWCETKLCLPTDKEIEVASTTSLVSTVNLLYHFVDEALARVHVLLPYLPLPRAEHRKPGRVLTSSVLSSCRIPEPVSLRRVMVPPPLLVSDAAHAFICALCIQDELDYRECAKVSKAFEEFQDEMFREEHPEWFDTDLDALEGADDKLIEMLEVDRIYYQRHLERDLFESTSSGSPSDAVSPAASSSSDAVSPAASSSSDAVSPAASSSSEESKSN